VRMASPPTLLGIPHWMWKMFTIECMLSNLHVQSTTEKVSGIDVSAWM
jgi:hypothetical protein